jgi:uncharacterized protein YjbI with pentapeptide repeats
MTHWTKTEVTAMITHPTIVSELNRMRTQALRAEAERRRLIASCRRSTPTPATSALGRAGGAGRAIAACRFRWSPRRLGPALARVFLAIGFVAVLLTAQTPAPVDAADACRGEAVGPGADLAFCDLRGADLVGADLRGADLSYADLTGAVTFGWRPVEIAPPVAACPAGAISTGGCPAEASGAGRCGGRPFAPGWRRLPATVPSATPVECWVAGNIELESARLVGARLAGADLRHANLRYADLRFADLAGADLTGADLTGATWSSSTCPDGSDSEALDGDGFTCLGNLAPDRQLA